MKGTKKSSLLTIPSCSFFFSFSQPSEKMQCIYSLPLILYFMTLINLPQSSSTQAL